MRDHAPVDEIDRRIIALLEEDARRSFGSIGRQVFLSASAVKRRVDGLRASGALLGFTALLEDDPDAREGTESFVSLTLPGVERAAVVDALADRPEVVQAWMVTGAADVVVRVRTPDGGCLEDLIDELKADGVATRVTVETVRARRDRLLERREGEAV
jgi:DNA-binding Lrp family transcriptional regulator